MKRFQTLSSIVAISVMLACGTAAAQETQGGQNPTATGSTSPAVQGSGDDEDAAATEAAADEAMRGTGPTDVTPAGEPSGDETAVSGGESGDRQAAGDTATPAGAKETPAAATEPEPRGKYWTSQGAAVDEPGTRSVDIAAGFPGINIMFSLPVVRHLEVDPFFGVNWWGPITTSSAIVSTNLGAKLKLNGYDRGPLQVALVADLSFGVSLYPDNGFQMNVTFPQLLVSGRVAEKVHLFGGMKVPVTLMVQPDFRLGIAFAGHFGIEYLISEKVHWFVTTEAGPEIYWVFKENPAPGDPSTQSAVGAWFVAMTGVALRF